MMIAAGAVELEAGSPPDLVPQPTTATGGKFALLGSLGSELPTYTSALVPGGTRVAEVLRRGTADPHMSKVAVPTTELALEFAKCAVPGATDSGLSAAQGFAAGLLSGAAAGVMLGPQLTDLLSQDTGADWSPTITSRGLRAVERLARNTYLAGPTLPVTAWLPAPEAVPPKVWEHFIKAIETTHGLPSGPDSGIIADFDPGPWLTPTRLRDGYQLQLDDARTESWRFWPWFFAISPILVMPSAPFAIARTLPYAKAFVQGGDLDERAVFEAMILAEGLGSLTPFLYSMIMWSKVGDHTEAFVTAVLMGLARLALPIGALAGSDDEDQPATTRWLGYWLPTAGADVYAALRAGFDPRRHPGNSKVFALQTVPGITSLAALAWLGLARAITGEEPSEGKSDWTFGVMSFATGVATSTAAALARRLETQVVGLKTEVVTPSLADVPSPTPPLAELGDEALAENAPSLRDHFVRVPTTRSRALPLRQSPRVKQSEQAGRMAENQDHYLVVPADASTSDLDTGIRDAADLATLLVLASSPTLGTVTVDPPADLADPRSRRSCRCSAAGTSTRDVRSNGSR